MDKEARQAFGQRLKAIRNKRGLTLSQLSDKTGFANSTLSGYESGARMPNAVQTAKIAKALNIPTDFLLSDDIEVLQDLSNLLTIDELHYNGVKLNEIEIKQIENFIQFIINNKMKRKD